MPETGLATVSDLAGIVPEGNLENVVTLKGEPTAALSLAAGHSVAESARIAGVASRTIRRRLAQPDYRAVVSDLRTRILDQAVGMLVHASTQAVVTLIDLLTARSEHVRLGASRSILEYSQSMSENLETRERLANLERVVYQTADHNKAISRTATGG